MEERAGQRYLEDLGRVDEQPGPWLRELFPELHRQCSEDGLCGIRPDHFAKMKRRFRTQAGRQVKRDGMPAPAAFRSWLEGELARHPFGARVQALERDIRGLGGAHSGPWTLVRTIDPWNGLNLNPYVCWEQTVFIAAGERGEPIHIAGEADPDHLAAACQERLGSLASAPLELLSSPELEARLRARLDEAVEALKAEE